MNADKSFDRSNQGADFLRRPKHPFFICVHLRSPALWLALATTPALAEVTVSEAWARSTVPQQKVSGAYMKLKSTEDARVIGATSPAAKVVEIHEMSMKDNVMRMDPVAALALPAGKTVEMKPGGYHVMLMDLVRPLKAGEKIAITLSVVGRDGKPRKVEAQAEVRAPR